MQWCRRPLIALAMWRGVSGSEQTAGTFYRRPRRPQWPLGWEQRAGCGCVVFESGVAVLGLLAGLRCHWYCEVWLSMLGRRQEGMQHSS